MELFEALSFIRKEKNMKINELSEKSGVPINTLKKILSGISNNPQLDTIKSIAKALDCTLDDIVYYDSKPHYTLEEQLYIKKYRLLNTDGKEKVGIYIDDLLANPKYKAEKKPIEIKIAARPKEGVQQPESIMADEDLPEDIKTIDPHFLDD